jgi:hypothetical protein
MELAPRLRVVDKVSERWPACQRVRPSATGRARPRCTTGGFIIGTSQHFYWTVDHAVPLVIRVGISGNDAQAACEPGGRGCGRVPVHPSRLHIHRTSPPSHVDHQDRDMLNHVVSRWRSRGSRCGWLLGGRRAASGAGATSRATRLVSQGLVGVGGNHLAEPLENPTCRSNHVAATSGSADGGGGAAAAARLDR